MKNFAYGGGGFGSTCCTNRLEKTPVHEWSLLFFRVFSSSLLIVWGLGAPGVGCWYVISCSVAQILCPPHVVCLCRVM